MTRLQRRKAEHRLARLHHALGDGPHSNHINLRQHLRGILEMIGDKHALDILNERV